MMQGEPGYGQQTTTVTQTSTSVQTNLRYDPSYFRSIPGLLKCAVLVLNIIIFICISLSDFANKSSLSFMSFLAGFGFWFSGVLLGFYIFHVVEKFFKIPWLKIEMVYCGLWTLFYLIGSAVVTSYMSSSAIFGVVGFFGFVNMILYGYDCFLKFKALQNGEIAQGERHVQKSVTTVQTPPAY